MDRFYSEARSGAVEAALWRASSISRSRLGQVAQVTGSPPESRIAGPPHEPRKQRPLKMTPTDITNMMRAKSPRVRRRRVMDRASGENRSMDLRNGRLFGF